MYVHEYQIPPQKGDMFEKMKAINNLILNETLNG